MEKKKLILINLPYILAGYFCDKIAWLWRVSPGSNASDKMMAAMNGLNDLFSNPLPSFSPKDLLIGIAGGVALRLVVYFKAKNAKKFRQGVEYGSARWGNAKDIEPYVDSVFENNVILTETERLMMSGRPKQPKYARNKNILVIGGSGSGKTRFFVKPNLMQMHSSYVVTDPKGTVLVECGKMLLKNGYKVKVLNTINFKKSMHYNPFAYIRSEKDILKLVNTIILNTKGEGQQSGEDFWVKAEKLYYTALIGYIWYECVEEEQNFTTLLDMINASEAREDDEEFKNPVDLMFDELEEREPDHFAVKQYKKYKLAAGVTDFDKVMLHNEQLRQVGIFYRGSDVERQLLYVMGDMENDTRTHHIHIVKWNGTEWKNYIHFRDYLNDNENMALQYQKVKEELESKYADNRVAYTHGKQDMIDIILDNQLNG